MPANCRGPHVWLITAAKEDLKDKEDTDLAEQVDIATSYVCVTLAVLAVVSSVSNAHHVCSFHSSLSSSKILCVV